jgi:hypothetical protein
MRHLPLLICQSNLIPPPSIVHPCLTPCSPLYRSLRPCTAEIELYRPELGPWRVDG